MDVQLPPLTCDHPGLIEEAEDRRRIALNVLRANVWPAEGRDETIALISGITDARWWIDATHLASAEHWPALLGISTTAGIQEPEETPDLALREALELARDARRALHAGGIAPTSYFLSIDYRGNLHILFLAPPRWGWETRTYYRRYGCALRAARLGMFGDWIIREDEVN